MHQNIVLRYEIRKFKNLEYWKSILPKIGIFEKLEAVQTNGPKDQFKRLILKKSPNQNQFKSMNFLQIKVVIEFICLFLTFHYHF